MFIVPPDFKSILEAVSLYELLSEVRTPPDCIVRLPHTSTEEPNFGLLVVRDASGINTLSDDVGTEFVDQFAAVFQAVELEPSQVEPVAAVTVISSTELSHCHTSPLDLVILSNANCTKE